MINQVAYMDFQIAIQNCLVPKLNRKETVFDLRLHRNWIGYKKLSIFSWLQFYYCWISPQRPPWGQEQVDVVERGLNKSQCTYCLYQKRGRCREVAFSGGSRVILTSNLKSINVDGTECLSSYLWFSTAQWHDFFSIYISNFQQNLFRFGFSIGLKVPCFLSAI